MDTNGYYNDLYQYSIHSLVFIASIYLYLYSIYLDGSQRAAQSRATPRESVDQRLKCFSPIFRRIIFGCGLGPENFGFSFFLFCKSGRTKGLG
jgi:hypothetical protein